VNESEITVKIVAIVEDYFGLDRVDNKYEKFINDGDTLHFSKENITEWYIPNEYVCGLVSYDCNKPIRMELHFLGAPEKCLIFNGPIKDNETDMRSWNSYKKGEEIIDYGGPSRAYEYIYTITPEHKAMAKEDYCSE